MWLYSAGPEAMSRSFPLYIPCYVFAQEPIQTKADLIKGQRPWSVWVRSEFDMFAFT